MGESLYNPREIALAAEEILPLAESIGAKLFREGLADVSPELSGMAAQAAKGRRLPELGEWLGLKKSFTKVRFTPDGPFRLSADGLPGDRNSDLFQSLVRKQIGLDSHQLDAGKAAILHPRFSAHELDFSFLKKSDLGSWGSKEQGFGLVEYQSLPGQRGYLKNADSVVRVTKTLEPGAAQGQADRASSGVFVRASGKIATNEHVVRNAASLQVETLSGQRYNAEVVAVDGASDLAILQIQAHPNAAPFPVPQFIDSPFRQSSKVAAIGHQGGLKDIIAAPGQWTSAGPQNKYMIDGVMPGASGSPIFDNEGRLVGLTAKIYPQIRKLVSGPSAETIETTLMRFGIRS